jgi:acetyl esterase/lipase
LVSRWRINWRKQRNSEIFTRKGIAVIGVNYRLSPKVNAAKAIDDAAAATAWVFKNIKNYGGNENLILFQDILLAVIWRVW